MLPKIGLVIGVLLVSYSVLGYAQAASLTGSRLAAIVYLGLITAGAIVAVFSVAAWRRGARAKSGVRTT
jgi:cytochrome c oxidase subunit IV